MSKANIFVSYGNWPIEVCIARYIFLLFAIIIVSRTVKPHANVRYNTAREENEAFRYCS